MKTLTLLLSLLFISIISLDKSELGESDCNWGNSKTLKNRMSKVECCGEYSYNQCALMITDEGYFFGIANVHVNHVNNYAQFEPKVRFFDSQGNRIAQIKTPLIRVGGTGVDPGKQIALYNKSPDPKLKKYFSRIAGFHYVCGADECNVNHVFNKPDGFDDGLSSTTHSLNEMQGRINPAYHTLCAEEKRRKEEEKRRREEKKKEASTKAKEAGKDLVVYGVFREYKEIEILYSGGLYIKSVSRNGLGDEKYHGYKKKGQKLRIDFDHQILYSRDGEQYWVASGYKRL